MKSVGVGECNDARIEVALAPLRTEITAPRSLFALVLDRYPHLFPWLRESRISANPLRG